MAKVNPNEITYRKTQGEEHAVILGDVEIGKVRHTMETEQLNGGWLVVGPAGTGYAYPTRWEAEKELISEFGYGAVYQAQLAGTTGRFKIAGQHDGQFVMVADDPIGYLPAVLLVAPEELRGGIAGGLFYLVDAAPMK